MWCERPGWLSLNSWVVSWTRSGIFDFADWTARRSQLFRHCATLTIKTWRVLNMLARSHVFLFYFKRINTFLGANACNTWVLLNYSVLREQNIKFLAILGDSIVIKPVLCVKMKQTLVFISWRNTFATATYICSSLRTNQQMLRTLSSKHAGWVHNKTAGRVSELSNHWLLADAFRHLVVAWTRSDEIHRNSLWILIIKSRVAWFIWLQQFSAKTAVWVAKGAVGRPFPLLFWGSENFFAIIFKRHLGSGRGSSNFS